MPTIDIIPGYTCITYQLVWRNADQIHFYRSINWVVVGTDNKCVYVYDIEKNVRTKHNFLSTIHNTFLDKKDGSTLIHLSADGILNILNTITGEVVAKETKYHNCLIMDYCNKNMVISKPYDSYSQSDIYLINIESLANETIESGICCWNINFSNSGRFFMIHYMFASLTAHTTAILPVMLAVGAAIPGLPIRTFAMLLCYSLGIMGVITPYATGPGPIYYGSGYISSGAFWKLGFIFGMIFLAALIGIGVPYLLAIK